MSMNFSRRDFLKCTGITVLAVGMGSLLTGCGGGGSGSGTAGINTPLTIDGITVKVNKFDLKDVKAGTSGFESEYKDAKFLFPEVTVANATGGTIWLAGASNFALKVDGKSVPDWTISVATAAAKGYNYKLLDESTGGYAIPNDNSCTGVLAYVVPTGWKQAELYFYPDATNTSRFVTFILTNR